jgi:hypothetical protein
MIQKQCQNNGILLMVFQFYTPYLKKILNSFRCPMCNAGIDIMDRRSYSFGCVQDCEHYSLYFNEFNELTFEGLSFYSESKKYCITKKHQNFEVIETDIWIRHLDHFGNPITEGDPQRIKIAVDLLSFKNFDKETMIRKIDNIFLMY